MGKVQGFIVSADGQDFNLKSCEMEIIDKIVYKSPISHRIGTPISIIRNTPLKEWPFNPKLNNQIITYLMADPLCGCAPPEWQGNIGEVFVFRSDGNELTKDSFYDIADFFRNLMYHDRYDTWHEMVEDNYISKTNFEKFIKHEHCSHAYNSNGDIIKD